MTSSLSTPWFPLGNPEPSADLRLFCFAHAGGNALMFRDWRDDLPQGVQVCPVQLPGHSTRLREKPFSRMTPLVVALEQIMGPWINQPFALYGHSMGAAISYELSQRLAAQGAGPEYLFVSGRRAPHLPFPLRTYHLPEAQFVEELRRLGGTPEEALANPELLALVLPLLRADFEVIETCEYVPRPLLFCPIVAMGGACDPQVSSADIRAWGEMTSAEFSMHILPGDHFFIHSSREYVNRILAERLRSLVAQPRFETANVS